MVSIFCRLYHVTQNCANLNDTDQNFLDFANKHLFYDDNNDQYSPIPVYPGIKHSMGPTFILNTLPYQGRFSTERKIIFNDTLRGWFCNAELIGEEGDPKSVQHYSNHVITVFVENQLVFFPSCQWMTGAFMIRYGYLLDSVIINDEISMSEMPAVQLLALLLEHDNFFEEQKN